MCETKGPVMSQGLLRTWLFAFFVAEQLESFSYLSLSKNLFDFKKLNDLPLSLEKRISAFVTHNDLAQKLAEKKAIYHKNCSSKYNQSRLSRLKCKTEKASAIIDTPRTSRRTVSAKNFTKACFFCDAKNDSEALYECHTLYLDMRVRKLHMRCWTQNRWKNCLRETWLSYTLFFISIRLISILKLRCLKK